MYTLYFMPGACSMAIHALLNELNQPVTLVPANDASGNRTAEFLKINPRGSVPVLADGDFSIREGAAIIQYLCDKHASDLLPKSGKARAEALEWLMFANATLHPAYARLFFTLRNVADGEVKTKLIATCIESINKLWAELDERLATQEYICGSQVSVVDILVTVIAGWAQQAYGGQIVFGANVKRLLKNISARPSFQKALAAEGAEYRAAA